MKPQYLIVHHTVSDQHRTTVKNIDDWHQARWPSFKSSLGYWVGYHYVILKDKTVQTRADNEEGAHALGGYNKNSIGIVLAGNFDIDRYLTSRQATSLGELLTRLKRKYNIPDSKIILHRNVWRTACPGRNIDRKFILSTMNLPVDDRYGTKRTWQSYLRERAMAFNPWLIKKIGRFPTNREINAFVYGYWGYPEVFDMLEFDEWKYKTKPEWSAESR